METRTENPQPELLPPKTVEEPRPKPTTIIPPPRLEGHKPKLYVLKEYAWRITAAWTWAHWLSIIVLRRDVLSGAEAAVIRRVVALISGWGFAPGNPAYIPWLAKWGWFFVVAGFAPSQLIGLGFYILFFPVLALVYALFRENVNESKISSLASKGKGLRQKTRTIPWISISAFGVFGWFFLYGGSSSAHQVLPGLVFSGVLFLGLVFRAFQRARPVEECDAAIFGGIGRAAASWAATTIEKINAQPPRSRTEASGALSVHRLPAGFYRFFAIFLRGRRGRDRIAVMVLIDYALSLLVLGFIAVLFWALAAKFALAPLLMPLSTALGRAASHFLPGIVPSPSFSANWADYGAAITAWVLFVIYVGPAASVLPRNQEESIKRTAPTYRLLRLVVIKWGQCRHRLRHLRDRLY